MVPLPLRRWSGRDRLGILVVGLAVGFVTGTVLLLTASATQTTALAAEFGAAGAVVPAEAAGPTATGVTVAPVSTGERSSVVLGVDPASGDEFEGIPGPPPSGVARVDPETSGRTFVGADRSLTLSVVDRPAGNGVVPPSWYVADRPTATALGGVDYAIRVADGDARAGDDLAPDGEAGPGSAADSAGESDSSGAADSAADAVVEQLPERGSPLRSALAYFVLGGRELRGLLWVAAGGAGALVAVTTFSVTRATVRERRRTIRVARAVGAPPWRLVAGFALRGGALGAGGVGVGYAVGVIVPNLAVNAAVAAGASTSLSPRVAPALTVLGPAYAGTVALSVVAGAAAVLPTVRRPIAAISDGPGGTNGRRGSDGPEATTTDDPEATDDPERTTDAEATPGSRGRLRGAVAPRLLGSRAVVPTAATLTVFVALALLVAGGAATVAPLAGGDAVAITEPGAAHPIASTVPAAAADAVAGEAVAASPEIVAFAVVDRRPVIVRGADYDRFAAVSDARVVAGEAPTRRHEAAVGADLADRLGLSVGDPLPLGGSTRSRLGFVTVTAVYEGPGITDDQLVVPLETARHLTGKPAGTVQFVRAEGLGTGGSGAGGGPSVAVDGLAAPDTVVVDRSAEATASVVNYGDEPATVTLRVAGTAAAGERTVRVDPLSRRTVALSFTVDDRGTGRIAVEAEGESVAVETAPAAVRAVTADAPILRGVPGVAPPDSAPTVAVRTADGRALADAAITVGNRTVRTDGEGQVALPLDDPGTTRVAVTNGGETATATVRVAPGVSRRAVVDLDVAPSSPTVYDRPTATVSVANPWDRPLNRTVAVVGPGGTGTTAVALAPGESRTIERTLERRPPGSYSVAVRVGEQRRAAATVTVAGDDRLAAALATRGQEGAASGIGRAAATVVGNVRLLVAALVGLAGVMTVGTVAAVFVRAVQARRRTIGIHRAVGAPPRRLIALLVADGVRIGAPAAAVAVGAGATCVAALDGTGVLTAYGVGIDVVLRPLALVAVFTGALGLVVVAVGGVAVALVRRPPAALLGGSGAAPPERRRSDSGRSGEGSGRSDGDSDLPADGGAAADGRDPGGED